MTDEQITPIPITDPYNVQIQFASVLLSFGHWNGILNLTLGTPRFTPTTTVDNPSPDLVVTSRLRLDLDCAQALYAALGRFIESARAQSASIQQANATTH